MITKQPSIISEALSPQGQLVRGLDRTARLAQFDHLITSTDMQMGLASSQQAIKERYDLENQAQKVILENYSRCSNGSSSPSPPPSNETPPQEPEEKEDEVIATATPDTDEIRNDFSERYEDNRQEHVHNGVPVEALTQLIKELSQKESTPQVDTATEAILDKLKEDAARQDAKSDKIADLLQQLVNKPVPQPVTVSGPSPSPVAPATRPTIVERVKGISKTAATVIGIGSALAGTAIGAAVISALSGDDEKQPTQQVQVEDPKVRVRFFYDDPEKGLIPIKSGVRGTLNVDGENKPPSK